MLSLRECRPRPDRLADHLPWAALGAPCTVLNKDGSFQRTLRYRGPDLDSVTATITPGRKTSSTSRDFSSRL